MTYYEENNNEQENIPFNEIVPAEVLDLWANTDVLDDFNIFAPGERVNVSFRDLPLQTKVVFKTTMTPTPIYSRPVLS